MTTKFDKACILMGKKYKRKDLESMAEELGLPLGLYKLKADLCKAVAQEMYIREIAISGRYSKNRRLMSYYQNEFNPETAFRLGDRDYIAALVDEERKRSLAYEERKRR